MANLFLVYGEDTSVISPTLGFNIKTIQYQKYVLYSLFIYQAKDATKITTVSVNAIFHLSDSKRPPVLAEGVLRN